MAAALATPVAPGAATMASHAACTSARAMAGTTDRGAGATLRGTLEESPQSRATHTHGDRRTTNDTRLVRAGLELMLPPLGRSDDLPHTGEATRRQLPHTPEVTYPTPERDSRLSPARRRRCADPPPATSSRPATWAAYPQDVTLDAAAIARLCRAQTECPASGSATVRARSPACCACQSIGRGRPFQNQ